MAHGNYNCCGICDCKIDYNGWEATTKEEICEDCLKKLKELNLNISNMKEFEKYIDDINYENYDEALKNLIELKYSFCYYNNEIDMKILYKFASIKGKNLEEILKSLEDKEVKE